MKKKKKVNTEKYKYIVKIDAKYTRNVPTDNSIFFYTMEGFEKHLKLVEKVKKLKE